MTSPSRQRPDRAGRYQSLRNFCLADSRRRSSSEKDVGLWWRVGVHGPIPRAAWVRETGELYVTRLGRPQDGRGEVVVLGQASDRSQLEAALDGWQDACPLPDSMTWLRHRAATLAPPENPAPSLTRAAVSQSHRRGGLSKSRPDARRRATTSSL
jgi:hypothetical protein